MKILAVLLLCGHLQPMRCAPAPITNEDPTKHNHTHVRDQRLFSSNTFDSGDIDVSGQVHGHDVSIGSSVDIKVGQSTFNSDPPVEAAEGSYFATSLSHKNSHPVDSLQDPQPRPALLIIDLQNDFITGSLKVPNALDIIKPISKLAGLPLWDKVVLSQDWHPSNHISFFSNLHLYPLDSDWESLHLDTISNISLFDQVTFAGPPPQKQVLWPDHCVQGTEGAEITKDLMYPTINHIIKKGTNPEVDAYSAFFDNTGEGSGNTGLDMVLKGVTEVVVVGLATDYCVGYTALDALSLGIPTTLLKDLSRPVTAEGEEDMLERVSEAGGRVTTVDQWIEDRRGHENHQLFY